MLFMCLLYHIQRYSDRNNMNSYNLSVCVSPSIMRPPKDYKLSQIEQTTCLRSDVVSFMIDNYVNIFSADNEYILGSESEIHFDDLAGEDSDSGTEPYRDREQSLDDGDDSEKEMEPPTPDLLFTPNIECPFGHSDSSIGTNDSDELKLSFSRINTPSVSLMPERVSLSKSMPSSPLYARRAEELEKVSNKNQYDTDYENNDQSDFYQRTLLRSPRAKRELSNASVSSELIEHKRCISETSDSPKQEKQNKSNEMSSKRKGRNASVRSNESNTSINSHDSTHQPSTTTNNNTPDRRNSSLFPKKQFIAQPLVQHFATEYYATPEYYAPSSPHIVFHTVDKRRQPAAPSYEEHIQKTQAMCRTAKAVRRSKVRNQNKVERRSVEDYQPPKPVPSLVINQTEPCVQGNDATIKVEEVDMHNRMEEGHRKIINERTLGEHGKSDFRKDIQDNTSSIPSRCENSEMQSGITEFSSHNESRNVKMDNKNPNAKSKRSLGLQVEHLKKKNENELLEQYRPDNHRHNNENKDDHSKTAVRNHVVNDVRVDYLHCDHSRDIKVICDDKINLIDEKTQLADNIQQIASNENNVAENDSYSMTDVSADSKEVPQLIENSSDASTDNAKIDNLILLFSKASSKSNNIPYDGAVSSDITPVKQSCNIRKEGRKVFRTSAKLRLSTSPPSGLLVQSGTPKIVLKDQSKHTQGVDNASIKSERSAIKAKSMLPDQAISSLDTVESGENNSTECLGADQSASGPFSLSISSTDNKAASHNPGENPAQTIHLKKALLTKAPKKIDQLTKIFNEGSESNVKPITVRELRRTNRKLKSEFRTFGDGKIPNKFPPWDESKYIFQVKKEKFSDQAMSNRMGKFNGHYKNGRDELNRKCPCANTDDLNIDKENVPSQLYTPSTHQQLSGNENIISNDKCIHTLSSESNEQISSKRTPPSRTESDSSCGGYSTMPSQEESYV